MIAQPVFVRTTFRRLLTAITITGVMAVVPAVALSQRQMNVKNSSGSVPPLAAPGDDVEQNVHFLTSVRFPPPALFFADPERKWTLGDFENSDRPTNQYSVTDEGGDDGEPAQQYEKPVQNPDNGDGVTIVQNPDEKTVPKPDVKPDKQQDGDQSQDILPTTAGPSEEVDGTTTTPVAEVGETETKRAIVATAAAVGTESPPTRDDQKSPNRQTVAHDRHKYPARLGLPIQTLMLSVRPLPLPAVDVRFHDINYYRSAATAVKRPHRPMTTTTDPRRER